MLAEKIILKNQGFQKKKVIKFGKMDAPPVILNLTEGKKDIHVFLDIIKGTKLVKKYCFFLYLS